MNKGTVLLFVDALINYGLGILCILYPFVAETIGVPIIENSFYPNLLGAVLFGIGVALTVECLSKRQTVAGLGFIGAVAINLSGAVVLVLWLVLGNLDIPLRGFFFLWSLAIILIVISLIELVIHLKASEKISTR